MHPTAPGHERRFTAPRLWAPLTDAQWDALQDHLTLPLHDTGPKLDRRARWDAFLFHACSGQPWRQLPRRFGTPAAVERHFRRLTNEGQWERLLRAVGAPDCPPALREVEYALCRAIRLAMPHLGMQTLELAQELGLLTALPMVPWMLPDRRMSEIAIFEGRRICERLGNKQSRPTTAELTRLKLLHRLAAGHPITRRFAPP